MIIRGEILRRFYLMPKGLVWSVLAQARSPKLVMSSGRARPVILGPKMVIGKKEQGALLKSILPFRPAPGGAN